MTGYDEHTGLESLERAECLSLLSAHHVGRVAFAHRSIIEVFPVNYTLDGDTIVLRSARDSLLATRSDGEPVSFQIDHADPLAHTGWSVLVYALSRVVTDPAARRRLERLPIEPWRTGHDDVWIGLTPLQINGRRIVHRGGA